jgi:hypothetical protein
MKIKEKKRKEKKLAEPPVLSLERNTCLRLGYPPFNVVEKSTVQETADLGPFFVRLVVLYNCGSYLVK